MAALLLSPGLIAAQDGEGEAERFRVDGYVSARVVTRKAEIATETPAREESDQDLYGQLRLDVTMPREKRYEFHFLGAFRNDLDGEQDRQGYYPLEDIGDTGTATHKEYIYEAHLDANYLLAAMPQLRLGRQAGTRDEPIFFDGVAADLGPGRRFNLTVYGGRAVHFFELDTPEGDDALWGAGVDYEVIPPTRLSLDYLSVDDIRDPGNDRQDELISLRIAQYLTEHWRLLVKGRNINGAPRDVRLRSLTAFPAASVDVSVIYFRQMRAQNELSNETSLYFDIVGQSEPFQSLDLKVRWQPGEDYAFDVGTFKRELLEPETTQGPFNREFSRSYLVFEVDNLILTGAFLGLTGERWKSDTTEVGTHGFDLGYKYQSGLRKGRVTLGSYFSLYKYDYYLELGERTEVRTYYVDVKAPVGDAFLVTANVEQEEVGGFESLPGSETFTRTTLGVRYDF
jgi:hypothetical protein